MTTEHVQTLSLQESHFEGIIAEDQLPRIVPADSRWFQSLTSMSSPAPISQMLALLTDLKVRCWQAGR